MPPRGPATLQDLIRFYDLMQQLQTGIGRSSSFDSPDPSALRGSRGVYFIFEPGEVRQGSGTGPRLVRVGTHGVTATSKSLLWQRLRNHRGTAAGGGNQRTSIFRRHIGGALMRSGAVAMVDGWTTGSSAPRPQRDLEAAVERQVSQIIRAMTFLWLPVHHPDEGFRLRCQVERNAIAVLTSAAAVQADPPSVSWLGRHALRNEISRSGLWNVEHVGCDMEADFLDRLEALIHEARLP